MNKFVLRQSLLPLLTAVIWGVAFVAQSEGMKYIEPFTFNMARNLIGALVLIPCIAFLKKINGNGDAEKTDESVKEDKKTLVTGGVCCGVLLFCGKFAADRYAVYKRWKSGIYHGNVYCDSTDSWNFSEKESGC